MVILLGLAVAVYWFFPYRFIAFVIGYIIALFSCWKTTGATQSNFCEYIKAYSGYLDESLLYHYLPSEEELNRLLVSYLYP